MAVTREKFKVYKNVFDEFTLQTLHKLSGQGHFDEIRSPVSIGKEANIFTAAKGNDMVILKIYRVTACDFKRMYDYLKFDPRYTKIRRKLRQVIFTWVQREYHNLLIARKAGIAVPTPYACLNDVIVMEMIGDPAPKLKDLQPSEPHKFFDECMSYVRTLYSAKLVHADLSAFNILNFNDHPIFIDFSQATPIGNPLAEEYLMRDITNLSNHFRGLGIAFDAHVLFASLIPNLNKKG